MAGTAHLGKPLGIAIAAALILYVGFKFETRRRFLRHLRKARIEPVELKRRMDAGDDFVIADLRSSHTLCAEPPRPFRRFSPRQLSAAVREEFANANHISIEPILRAGTSA